MRVVVVVVCSSSSSSSSNTTTNKTATVGIPILNINKKLSHRRGTARCIVSVEILPTATPQSRTTCRTSPEQIEVMKLEG